MEISHKNVNFLSSFFEKMKKFVVHMTIINDFIDSFQIIVSALQKLEYYINQ